MTRRLILVRHGVTDWNREGRFQGHLDPHLSRQGRREARLLAARLVGSDARPGRVVTSSLSRARQTAEPIAAGLGVPLQEDPRLIEIGQGEWEGRTHRQLATEDAERYAAWRSKALQEPPGGEPLEQVAARVREVLGDVLALTEETVCLVSHGGTLRVAAGLLLGLAPRITWRMDLDNGSVSCLATDDGDAWRLERWNDTGHLLGRTAQHVDEAEGEPLAL